MSFKIGVPDNFNFSARKAGANDRLAHGLHKNASVFLELDEATSIRLFVNKSEEEVKVLDLKGKLAQGATFYLPKANDTPEQAARNISNVQNFIASIALAASNNDELKAKAVMTLVIEDASKSGNTDFKVLITLLNKLLAKAPGKYNVLLQGREKAGKDGRTYLNVFVPSVHFIEPAKNDELVYDEKNLLHYTPLAARPKTVDEVFEMPENNAPKTSVDDIFG